MRKDVLATVSAVALSTGFAFAAQAAPPIPMPIFTWTGCYVGVQAGGDFGFEVEPDRRRAGELRH